MRNELLPFFVYKKRFCFLFSFLFFHLFLFGQNQVTGKVVSDAQAPLAGVSIVIKGNTKGTTTDVDGKFSLQAAKNDVLIFSHIGFADKEVRVGNNVSQLLVELSSNTGVLGEVVVTGLGLQRKTKGLTYSIQKVDGQELTKVPQTNFMNSLSGKVAGMTVLRGGAGLGGSVKVILRGNKSAQQTNQPLYVVDGLPIFSFAKERGNSSYSMQDDGDAISNLNPDDIESISVLKGASAAALYGSQAANGVILITTKKGKAGVSTINLTSSFTTDVPYDVPKLQNSYGQTSPGSIFSWGDPISSAPDNIGKFFKNGTTWVNSVGVSTGTDKMQTYISYANTKATGIVQDNELTRHNFTLREGMRLLNDKLKLDGGVDVIMQKAHNNPVFGTQSTPLVGLYLFPRSLDMEPYKNHFEFFDSSRYLYTQNWPFINAANQNPYWIINRVLLDNVRNRTIFNMKIQYDLTDWLNIQARGNMDRLNDVITNKYFSGTAGYAGPNGGFNITDQTNIQYYGDVLLTAAHHFGDIQLNGVLGSSITDNRVSGESANATDLNIANIFTIQNMTNGRDGAGSLPESHQQLQAVFGNISVGYKDWLTLDVTGRNDWSSNLSYTPNGSYFYPSAGAVVILSQLAKLPAFISFAKLRGSYAIVGNTVPLYVTNPSNYYTYSNSTNIIYNNNKPFTDLKPEKTRSLELGADIRLLQNRVTFDFTYYKTNSINQYFSILVPPGTGYSTRFINGGDIQNSGIEIMGGYNSLPKNKFGWSSIVNFSLNKNVVRKLAEGVNEFVLSTDYATNYYQKLTIGGSYGDLYGSALQHDSATGKVLINATGSPIPSPNTNNFLGNPNPKFKLGWNNNFTYKNFHLGLLIDGSFGGKVFSATQAIMDQYGVSKATGDARKKGSVAVDGITVTGTPVSSVDPLKWYSAAIVDGEYIYDATIVRIRELSLGYSLPDKLLHKTSIKNARISLTGRNLWYIHKKSPYDPDLTYSSGNGLAGIDVFGLPSTRSMGVNINIGF